MSKWFDGLTLFTSLGTLLCCALPAMLVMLGAGSVMAALAANVPGLVWLSSKKTLVFSVAAVMLLAAGILQWRARYQPCPTDPVLAARCMRSRRNSKVIYLLSVMVFCIGAFMAFIAPTLFYD